MEVVNQATDSNIIWHPHPVLPAANRQAIQYAIKEGSSIRDVLIGAGIDTLQPIHITLDDRLLTVEEWDLVCPTQGQLINVQATVMGGGGGGGGGSNPIQIVALIAIIAISVYTLGAGSAFFAAYGATASAVAIAGATIAGSMIVNAVFAASNPATDNSTNGSSGTYSQASPTYSLAGGSNRSRPYESMPVVMGQMRFFPDYGSKPFLEYQGEDQYLYQIFNLGLSTAAYSDWKIGTTPLTDYQNVSWVYPDSTGKINGFVGNVDTISGSELTNAVGWVTRATSANTYRIGIDIEGVLYYANSAGGLDGTSVQISVQYRALGSSTWLTPSYITTQGNGFAAGHYENYTYYVEQGEWQYDYATESAYWVDTSYYATGSRFVSGGGTVIVSGSTQTPRRATLFIDVPVGEYEVRLHRDTGDTTDPRLQNKTSWSSLRSYQQDTADYYGQNRQGLTIRASSQLNGTVQQLSAVSNAKANYWNGSAWVMAETSNPAHWYMDFALGRRDSRGRLLYGVGLNANQIDLAGLSSWATFCATEKLTFNAVLDGQQTAADILNAIARCGFASPTWSSGKIGVVWDARNASPVAAFGMSNIIRGSFNVSYITEQLAEEIIVRYVNPDKDWVQDEVRVNVPNVTTPTRSSTIDLLGCTNKAMAGKFANYLAAQQYYRKRRIQWECDFEGFVCQRGDVVLLSHDLTQWGYSGRVVSHSGNTITLDRTITHSSSTDYLMLKHPDGSMVTYTVTSGYGDTDTLTLSSAPDFQLGMLEMDHMWFFSPLSTVGKRVKILSVQPSTESLVTVIATDEDPEFYAAWDGSWREPAVSTLLLSSKPILSNVSIMESLYKKTTGIVSKVLVSFSVSGSFDHANIRYKLNDNEWVNASTYTTSFEFDATEIGSLTVEICPVSTIAGDTVTKSTTLYGLSIPPADVSSFLAYMGDSGVVITFDPCPDIDWAYTEIRQGTSWDTATPVVNALSDKYLAGWLPSGVNTFLARHVDTTGHYSENVSSTNITINAPSGITFSRSEVQENSVALGWGSSKTSQTIASYKMYLGNAGDSFAASTFYGSAGADSRSDIVIFRSSGSKVIWMTATDLAGNVSTPTSINVIVTLPANFVLASEYDENWSSGTITNGYIDGGSLYLPVNPQAWSDHFSTRGYATIGDQISAGYPLYFEPSSSTGSYYEQHDIGKILANGKITVTPVLTVLSGTLSSSYQIDWSVNGTTWVSGVAGASEVQATNFRYVRVTFSVTSSGGDDLIRVDRLHVSISSSTLSEFGTLVLNAADTTGTQYACQKSFLDVVSANATPNSSPAIAKLNVIIDDSGSIAYIYVQAWDVSNARCGGTVSLNIGGY